MHLIRYLVLITIVFSSQYCIAQLDSSIESLQKIPAKYLSEIDNKIDKYSNRISSKTEKTLAKLSKWENKIHLLLQKVNPEVAKQLFENNQITFATLLQKIKEGQAIAENAFASYDNYRDKLTTSLKYLELQKDRLKNTVTVPLDKASKKMEELEQDVKNSEAVEKFIKERKKMLLDEAVKYIGKSKYLTKIDKEAFYYVETVKNYRELFTDKKKAEELALKLLNKIPAFSEFINNNGILASIFKRPGNIGPASTTAILTLAGLQTRSNVNALMTSQINTGGPDALSQVRQQLQAGQKELGKLKDMMAKYGSSNSEIPSFKPNMQKTKTFSQRIIYEANVQFSKSTNFLPSQSDIALGIGYKINDKSIAGIATSVKVGLGSGWNNIKFTMNGIGLRSYIDWKIKGNFYMSGGYEQNYISQVNNIQQLRSYDSWQASGLVGLTKKLKIKGNKSAKIQVLYDFLSYKHVPVTQPFVFRTGFSFK